MNKQSATIPLSPEERYEASQLFGRSLFSALQLAREREHRRNAAMSAAEGLDDERTLKIPIPRAIMPGNKLASLLGPPGYLSPDDEQEPPHGEGMIPHVKRNIGKYVGSYGGAGTGAAAAVINALKKNSRTSPRELLRRGGMGGLVGGLTGTALGHVVDSANKHKHTVNMGSSQDRKRQLIQSMLASGELESMLGQQEGYKSAGVHDDEEPGILANALKLSNNPIRMLVGSQSGFRDAKRDYYMQQRKMIDQELMKAQKDYIDTLSKIKTGEAESETPHVDAFCNGIAHMTVFGKTADFKEPEIEEGSLQRFLGDAVGLAKKPFQPAINAAASGLLSTGAGSAWLTYLLRKKMREEPDKYTQENLPTRVELQPYA